MAKPKITRTATHPATGEKVTYTGTRDVKWATFDRGAKNVDGSIRVPAADEEWRHIGWSSAATEKAAKAAGRSTSVYGVEYMAVPVDADEPEVAEVADADEAAEAEWAGLDAERAEPTTQERDCPACDCDRRRRGGSHLGTCAIVVWEARQIEQHEAADEADGGAMTLNVPSIRAKLAEVGRGIPAPAVTVEAEHAYVESGFFPGLCGICGKVAKHPRHLDEVAVAQLVIDVILEATIELAKGEPYPVMVRALALAAGRPQGMTTRFSVSNPPLEARGLIVPADNACGYAATPLGLGVLRVLRVIETDRELAEALLDLERREVWVAERARACCVGDEYGHAEACVNRPAEVAALAERTAAALSPAELFDTVISPALAEINTANTADLHPSGDGLAWRRRVLGYREATRDLYVRLHDAISAAYAAGEVPFLVVHLSASAVASAEGDVQDWAQRVARFEPLREAGEPTVALPAELPARTRPEGLSEVDEAVEGDLALDALPEVHLDTEAEGRYAKCGRRLDPEVRRSTYPAGVTCVPCLEALWGTQGEQAPPAVVQAGYDAAKAVFAGLTGSEFMPARPMAKAEPSLDEVPAEPRGLPRIG